MSNLIPHPDDPRSAVAVSKTELKPVKATDEPGLWRKFANFVRQNIGLKPLHLAERFAEAEIDSREAENHIKLLKAKGEYELVQAEIRRRDLEAEGQHEKVTAEAEQIRAKARSAKARARIAEAAARAIERRGQTPEQAMKRLREIVDKIRNLGGDVEIEPLDGELYETDDEESEGEG